MVNIFSNLSGTTSDTFVIGKGGPTVAKCSGIPSLSINTGSIALSDNGNLYKKYSSNFIELASTFHITILQNQLDANGNITINHNLNKQYVMTQSYDTTTNGMIYPDSIIATDSNNIQLSFNSYRDIVSIHIVIVA